MTAVLLALAFFTGAALLVMALNAFALLSWRRTRDAHWTERARLLYPARTSALYHLLMVPAFSTTFWAIVYSHPPLPWPGVAASTFLGAQLGSYFYAHAVLPQMTRREWLREVAVGYLLRLASWAPLIIAGIAMPAHFNFKTVLLAIFAIGMHFAFLYGLGLKIAALIGGVEAAPERVDRIVAGVAASAGIAPPESLVFRGFTANAAAVPHLQKLFFTTRLLTEFSDAEITAITAHEVAHLTEPAKVVRTRLFFSFVFIPYIFARPIFTRFDAPGILLLISGVFLLGRLVHRLRRRMEVRADTLALAHSGPDPVVYARTLERIYEINQMPAVMPGARQVHPHLYDRLLAAGLTPDYPRPRPPARARWTVFFLIASFLLALFAADTYHQDKKQSTRLRHHRRPS